jgi:hypothetical protein
MYEDFLHEDLKFPSGVKVQFDVYIPADKMAFEYQGEHHYHDIYIFGSQFQISERDEYKKRLCKLQEITLIEVPYWWDFRRESLVATIYQKRPELIGGTPKGNPIPESPT